MTGVHGRWPIAVPAMYAPFGPRTYWPAASTMALASS